MAMTTSQSPPPRDNTVRVHVTPDVMFNLEKAQSVQKSVLGRLGCPGCTSGFNLSLVAFENEFKVDAQLKVSPISAS